MEGDNLTNRYDQLVFAGSALGVIQQDHESWYDVFFQHLDIAVQLHEIQDVYIMEHRDCGAYAKFLGKKGKYGGLARRTQARRGGSSSFCIFSFAMPSEHIASERSQKGGDQGTLGRACPLLHDGLAWIGDVVERRRIRCILLWLSVRAT